MNRSDSFILLSDCTNNYPVSENESSASEAIHLTSSVAHILEESVLKNEKEKFISANGVRNNTELTEFRMVESNTTASDFSVQVVHPIISPLPNLTVDNTTSFSDLEQQMPTMATSTEPDQRGSFDAGAGSWHSSGRDENLLGDTTIVSCGIGRNRLGSVSSDSSDLNIASVGAGVIAHSAMAASTTEMPLPLLQRRALLGSLSQVRRRRAVYLRREGSSRGCLADAKKAAVGGGETDALRVAAVATTMTRGNRCLCLMPSGDGGQDRYHESALQKVGNIIVSAAYASSNILYAVIVFLTCVLLISMYTTSSENFHLKKALENVQNNEQKLSQQLTLLMDELNVHKKAAKDLKLTNEELATELLDHRRERNKHLQRISSLTQMLSEKERDLISVNTKYRNLQDQTVQLKNSVEDRPTLGVKFVDEKWENTHRYRTKPHRSNDHFYSCLGGKCTMTANYS